MPNISGEWPNGSPVHRIQDALKMHKTQVDLVPIGRAFDEVSRFDGQPSDCTAQITILDEVEPLRGAVSSWAIQSPRRHVLPYLRGLGRSEERNLSVDLAAIEGVFPIDLLRRGAGEVTELRCRMSAHISIVERFGE
ncbi:hypothetical protein ACE103_09905 [Bradyrhizobium sp. ma5]|uniref:hypothetical protein n=1 Tax=Bradyrhizobium sp. ma5 TaxID=3344828 RepID=UPI0035D48B4C